MSGQNKLITAQELADLLGLSVATIWRYTREKRIPYVEIGKRQYRYEEKQVLAALSGGTQSEVLKEEEAVYQREKLTYDDYAKLPEEPGFRHEVIDGVLIRDPSPSYQHQRVSRRLQRILEDYFAGVDPKGEVFDAPLDLNLEVHTVVQPDLLYFPGSRPVQRTPIGTLPELVVEILSPSTSRKDRVAKLNHYQSVGVPHYWIVDPHDGLVETYELRDGIYSAVARSDAGLFSHPSFPGLSFELGALFSLDPGSQ